MIDKIIVATDSDKIEETLNSFDCKKTQIYRRNAENASATTSTESVMLEYIDFVKLNNNDTFVLVQATSPLTKTTRVARILAECLWKTVHST